jgi:hypothetical protein
MGLRLLTASASFCLAVTGGATEGLFGFACEPVDLISGFVGCTHDDPRTRCATSETGLLQTK